MTDVRSRHLQLFATTFPPDSAVGAIRPGSLARWLPRNGWSVEVFCRAHAGTGARPGDVRVHEIANREPLQALMALRQTGHGGRGGGSVRARMGLGARLVRAAYYPDPWRGMIPGAVRAGLAAAKLRPPALVYGTGPNWSTVIAASLVARRLGVPLVTEFRDPWAESLYHPRGGPTALADRLWERQVVRQSALVVAVTETAAADLRRHHPGSAVGHAPVGFDPALLDLRAEPPTDGPFRVLHAGSLYGDRRDPTPLFRAVAASRDAGVLRPDDLELAFLGPDSHAALAQAGRCGVSAFVRALEPVDREEAQRLVATAHANLLLIVDDPRETTAVPAKLYEQLALGRPILGLGPEENPSSALVRRAAFGCYSTDPDVLRATLEGWVEAHRAGGIESTPADALLDLRQDRIVARLAEALTDLCG